MMRRQTLPGNPSRASWRPFRLLTFRVRLSKQCLSLELTRFFSDDDQAVIRTRGHVPAAKPLYFGDGGQAGY